MHDALMVWLGREASTRSAALIRIGLAAVLLARYADDRILYRNWSLIGVLSSLAFFGLSVALLLGWFSRLSAGLLCGVLVYFYYGIGGEEYAHHHTYLLMVATGLLALAPCGGSYSLDRWRSLRRAEAAGQPPPPERGPAWALSLLTVQLTMIYFWGAVDKTRWVYLSGVRMQQYFMHYYSGSEMPTWWGSESMMAAAAIGSVLLEYFLVVALWWPRVRLWALVAGALFHGILYVTLPVSSFTATMCVLYLAALDPEAVHRAIERLSGHGAGAVTPASARSASSVEDSASSAAP